MKNIKFHLYPKYSCDQNHENIVTNSGKSTLLSRIFTCFSMGGLFSGVLPYKAIRQKRAFLQNTRKIRTRVHNIPINNSSRKSKHFKYCVGRVLWQNAHNLTRYRLGKFINKSKMVLFWCILLGLHDLIMSMIKDHGQNLKEHPPLTKTAGGGGILTSLKHKRTFWNDFDHSEPKMNLQLAGNPVKTKVSFSSHESNSLFGLKMSKIAKIANFGIWPRIFKAWFL